ncbi:YceI family protein [Lewinella cohaerens]|uniref:YceI family protein n=1 Tax=Lewinella cohaerens TaxID=70995 RepID=UPI000382E569|nr:YceI family protein [Lewinella cohaerens]
MQKFFFLLAVILLVGGTVNAQKYFTRAGKVTFTSEAPVEKIEAVNQSATAILDTESSRMEFAILIKAFQFEKALMQEHFNENYMESSTYPKATFKGQIDDATAVNWGKDGSYPVTVSGDMTIHGVTQKLTAPGTITIKEGSIAAQSTFTVAVADYGIEIPSVVAENIAKEVTIAVDVQLAQLNK